MVPSGIKGLIAEPSRAPHSYSKEKEVHGLIFFMIIMASGDASGCVHTTMTVVGSRKMMAILQLMG